MKINRGTSSIQHKCNYTTQKSNCKVVCLSSGEKLVDIESVNFAYFSERLKKIDSSVAGFFLVIDAVQSENNMWVTLQNNSSCYFKGMTPVL